ncbi:MAG: hypothetical protein M3320_01445, partial [Actinomycetota bacterium]|nr:hypothetical protein [Actinomycetota bacterium]
MRRALVLALLALAVAAPGASAALPFTIGTGSAPHLAVDATADTAHVVWIDEARRLMHCRLPRGATACAAPTAVDGAGPMDDPFVLVHPGGALSVVMAHDGEQRTYAWRSTDGGATWSPRTTIYAFGGEQQPAEPVLGPGPGEVTLAAWTWDRTTGRGQGSVWTASLDGGEAAAATHATFADALDPSLAVTAAGDLLLS